MVAKDAVECLRRGFHGIMADGTMTMEVDQSRKQIITAAVDYLIKSLYLQVVPYFRDGSILKHDTFQ